MLSKDPKLADRAEKICDIVREYTLNGHEKEPIIIISKNSYIYCRRGIKLQAQLAYDGPGEVNQANEAYYLVSLGRERQFSRSSAKARAVQGCVTNVISFRGSP